MDARLLASSESPQSEVCADAPPLNPLSLRTRGKVLVIELSFQLRVEVQHSLPPLAKGNLSSPHGTQPFSRFAGNRESQVSTLKEFESLETEPGAVHGVLGGRNRDRR